MLPSTVEWSDSCRSPIFGQCAGLVGADGSRAPHGLTSRQHPDKVIVLHHLLHAVGQGDGDRQGQPFRDCHDDNGHSKDEELEWS